jgi:hypothetical protein
VQNFAKYLVAQNAAKSGQFLPFLFFAKMKKIVFFSAALAGRRLHHRRRRW